MKRFILCLSFAVIAAFAQEPERTAEGYRIVRIDLNGEKAQETSSQAVDSIAKAKVQAEYLARPVVPFKFSLGISGAVSRKSIGAVENSYGEDENIDLFDGSSWQLGLSGLIPLNENSIALRFGVFYDRASLDRAEYISVTLYDGNNLDYDSKLTEERITIPALFVFKGSRSGILFESGLQVAIPLSSSLDNKYRGDLDLVASGYRKSLDVSFLLGLGYLFKNGLVLDGFIDLQFNGTFKDGIAVDSRAGATFSQTLQLTYYFL